MATKRVGMMLVCAALGASAFPAWAQSVQASYPKMAPLEQYLMADQSAEIALARSAAPDSISRNARVLVLGRNGYEVAVPGTNHFVCLVERSWSGAPQYWNPKIRGPNCLNGAAAEFYLPMVFLKTRLALAGKSQEQIAAGIHDALTQKQLASPGAGAMSYMLSKRQYLNDQGKNWHPHVMFYMPLVTGRDWGANLKGSPIISSDDTVDQITTVMVPLATWSDGTPDVRARHQGG